MKDLLLTVLSFGFALSVLIAVHEFGHFWVARRLGVKVLRFSIGFGKPLWSWRGRGPDATEYAVAAVPLGGYVKMLDEHEGAVPEAELHRAFNRQPVGKRFAIVAAGPVFNFLFAVFAYWLMFVTGVPGMKAVVGEVQAGSLSAAAGIHSGQRIISAGNEETPTWGAVLDTLLPYALRKEPVEVVATQGGIDHSYRLRFDRIQGEVQPDTLVDSLGIEPYQPTIPPVIGEVSSGSPASRGGLQRGDRVERIDGRPVEDWGQLVELVRGSPDKLLNFSVRRDGHLVNLTLRPESVAGRDGRIGRIGAGVHIDPKLTEGLRAEWRHGPIRAVGESVKKTWDMIALTLDMLGQMVVGRVSTENISGPITIALYAKSSAVAGLAPFLQFLGVVSLSLGVLNLLPIPVLDGGHLMFYVVEAVKRSPVSERVELIGQKIGIGIIVALMVVAFYNDLTRLAG